MKQRTYRKIFFHTMSFWNTRRDLAGSSLSSRLVADLQPDGHWKDGTRFKEFIEVQGRDVVAWTSRKKSNQERPQHSCSERTLSLNKRGKCEFYVAKSFDFV